MTIVWNAQRVSEGLKEIDTARPRVLSNVKRLLNEYHKAQESSRYYDILLGDWVERYLHLIYVASQTLASESNNSKSKEIPVKVLEVLPLSDSAEFFSNFVELAGFAVSVTKSVLVDGPKSISISQKIIKVQNSFSQSRSELFSAALLRFISVCKPGGVMFVKPISGSVPKVWISAMFSWRKWAIHDDLGFQFSTSVSPDKPWREANISEITGAMGLAEVANAMLTAFIPVCFVEGFQELKQQINKARPKRFDHLYSSQSLWTHFAFKLLAAQWCEQGTKLHYHQHGGWYGLDEVHVGELYESRVADAYYTWGWSRGAANTKPLSPVAPKLLNAEKTFDSMICFDQPRQIYRLQYFPLPGTLQNMYNQTADFVRERESKTLLKVRLFLGEYGATQKDLILGSGQNLSVDNSEEIFTQYAKSRLVIHSYLGTSWLETIGNNIPTVCFYDVDAYRFRSDAKSLLNDLVEVGILHLSGLSAAEHVNVIDGDVEGWWRQNDVQRARENFAYEYANYKADWKEIWQENFLAMLNK